MIIDYLVPTAPPKASGWQQNHWNSRNRLSLDEVLRKGVAQTDGCWGNGEANGHGRYGFLSAENPYLRERSELAYAS